MIIIVVGSCCCCYCSVVVVVAGLVIKIKIVRNSKGEREEERDGASLVVNSV